MVFKCAEYQLIVSAAAARGFQIKPRDFNIIAGFSLQSESYRQYKLQSISGFGRVRAVMSASLVFLHRCISLLTLYFHVYNIFLMGGIQNGLCRQVVFILDSLYSEVVFITGWTVNKRSMILKSWISDKNHFLHQNSNSFIMFML